MKTPFTNAEDNFMQMPERIAKLEVQVQTTKDSSDELKTDIKEIHSRITTGYREIVEKLEIMENRISQRMKENSETSLKQHNSMEVNLKIEIKEIKDRVNILERWRWMIVGGALSLGYLVSTLDLISKVFK